MSDHCVEQVFYLPFNMWNTKQVNWPFLNIFCTSYIKVILSIHNAKKLLKWLNNHQINIPCDAGHWLKYPNLHKLKERNSLLWVV